MWNKIVNPRTNRNVNINSRLGKKIQEGPTKLKDISRYKSKNYPKAIEFVKKKARTDYLEEKKQNDKRHEDKLFRIERKARNKGIESIKEAVKTTLHKKTKTSEKRHALINKLAYTIPPQYDLTSEHHRNNRYRKNDLRRKNLIGYLNHNQRRSKMYNESQKTKAEVNDMIKQFKKDRTKQIKEKYKNPPYDIDSINLKLGSKCSKNKNCKSNKCKPPCTFGSKEFENNENIYNDFRRTYEKIWKERHPDYTGPVFIQSNKDIPYDRHHKIWKVPYKTRCCKYINGKVDRWNCPEEWKCSM